MQQRPHLIWSWMASFVAWSRVSSVASLFQVEAWPFPSPECEGRPLKRYFGLGQDPMTVQRISLVFWSGMGMLLEREVVRHASRRVTVRCNRLDWGAAARRFGQTVTRKRNSTIAYTRTLLCDTYSWRAFWLPSPLGAATTGLAAIPSVQKPPGILPPALVATPPYRTISVSPSA
jgi:hypothetical protein